MQTTRRSEKTVTTLAKSQEDKDVGIGLDLEQAAHERAFGVPPGEPQENSPLASSKLFVLARDVAQLESDFSDMADLRFTEAAALAQAQKDLETAKAEKAVLEDSLKQWKKVYETKNGECKNMESVVFGFSILLVAMLAAVIKVSCFSH